MGFVVSSSSSSRVYFFSCRGLRRLFLPMIDDQSWSFLRQWQYNVFGPAGLRGSRWSRGAISRLVMIAQRCGVKLDSEMTTAAPRSELCAGEQEAQDDKLAATRH